MSERMLLMHKDDPVMRINVDEGKINMYQVRKNMTLCID